MKTFPEPPFMQDLHRIREQHHEATKNLSPAELVCEINGSARRSLAELGYELVPTASGKGRYMIQRSTAASKSS